jgi:hypothetical protein
MSSPASEPRARRGRGRAVGGTGNRPGPMAISREAVQSFSKGADRPTLAATHSHRDQGTTMRIRSATLTTLAAAALVACSGESGIIAPLPAPAPAPAVLLRNVVLPSLPSPYYHFEYDSAGRVTVASFASGFTMYNVTYDHDRISALVNNTLGNHDRLDYVYDGAGRVATVTYVRPDGTVSTSVALSYDGARLTGLERSRAMASGFVVDKMMSFSYYPDGNVREIMEFHPSIEGFQAATTTIVRFEQYDDKINVDGFSLLHAEFFDHLVLLPGVQLQTGNPARVVHTGDGINYQEDYTYVYDDNDRPLTKAGVLTYLNGTDVGKQFPVLSVFTYY